MSQISREQLEQAYNSSPGGIVRNCTTCAHRQRTWLGDHCVLCGFYCSVQRALPSPPCDINLSGWTPRPPSGWTLFIRWLCPWLRP